MATHDLAAEPCPFESTLELLGQKHVLGIIRVMGDRTPWRFNELQSALEVPPKTLSARLKDLVGEGLVDRTQYNEIPPRVEYVLTEKGEGLCPIFRVLEDWHETHEE